jgi:hypothetical protein
MKLAWVFLPAAAFWTAVAPVHGKLVVSGPLDRGPRCGYLTVDPVSLHSSFARRRCGANGFRVVFDRHSQWAKVFVGRRLAFRYEDGSTSRPLSATSGDSLWLYDVLTDRGPLLQRWSLRSGRLAQELRFPVQLFRPVLAANGAGAWLMAAPNGGVSGQATAALYHVTTRVTVVQRGPRAAMWMTGHGRTLWLETVTGLDRFALWRYDGTHGRVLRRFRRPLTYTTTYGGGALWGVSTGCGERLDALRLDGLTGASRVVARVPLLDCNQVGPGAWFRGAFWLVDGPKLYRVPIR